MLVDLKEKLDDPAIKELIAYSVFPDPDRLDKTIEKYKTDDSRSIFGYESEGEVIGAAGFRMEQDGTLELLHISVIPSERGKGYGRGLLLELIQLKHPLKILAETDEEAVDFYRNVGFEIQSLGEQYPGVERFKCTYVTSMDQ